MGVAKWLNSATYGKPPQLAFIDPNENEDSGVSWRTKKVSHRIMKNTTDGTFFVCLSVFFFWDGQTDQYIYFFIPSHNTHVSNQTQMWRTVSVSHARQSLDAWRKRKKLNTLTHKVIHRYIQEFYYLTSQFCLTTSLASKWSSSIRSNSRAKRWIFFL